MNGQGNLFETSPLPSDIYGSDIKPIAAESADVPRLSGQNGTIYDMLSDRPHTNNELAAVSLKYTSRISDIRKWIKKHGLNEQIVCTKCGGGLSSYELVRQVAK